MTPIQYCNNLQAHATATCFCMQGTTMIRYEGQYYTYKEFYDAFPIHPVNIRSESNYKGPNSDRTKEWMVL